MSDFFDRLFVNHGVSGVAGVSGTRNQSAVYRLGKIATCNTSNSSCVLGVANNRSDKSVAIQHDRSDETPATPETLDLSMLSSDERYNFEERAGIMEFDGGMTRQDAERAAFANVIEIRNCRND